MTWVEKYIFSVSVNLSRPNYDVSNRTCRNSKIRMGRPRFAMKTNNEKVKKILWPTSGHESHHSYTCFTKPKKKSHYASLISVPHPPLPYRSINPHSVLTVIPSPLLLFLPFPLCGLESSYFPSLLLRRLLYSCPPHPPIRRPPRVPRPGNIASPTMAPPPAPRSVFLLLRVRSSDRR